MKCAVTLKTGCLANLIGAFSSNVGNVGQCANAQKDHPLMTSARFLTPSSPSSAIVGNPVKIFVQKSNKIEGTPILKLAMVKRLEVIKIFQNKLSKNSSKNSSNTSSKNLSKNSSTTSSKNSSKTLSKNFFKKLRQTKKHKKFRHEENVYRY